MMPAGFGFVQGSEVVGPVAFRGLVGQHTAGVISADEARAAPNRGSAPIGESWPREGLECRHERLILTAVCHAYMIRGFRATSSAGLSLGATHKNMTASPDLSIVVPAYNEANRIKE